jgi:hypothetical protein|tara:strand:- start:2 stop:265 length:264 start_codon:yes stop_codon:yes gene_type:complete
MLQWILVGLFLSAVNLERIFIPQTVRPKIVFCSYIFYKKKMRQRYLIFDKKKADSKVCLITNGNQPPKEKDLQKAKITNLKISIYYF